MTGAAQLRRVAVGLAVDGQRVLLARRAMTKLLVPGKWHLPGGHLEPGETAVRALTREWVEELGINIVPREEIITFSYQDRGAFTEGVVLRVHGIDRFTQLKWSASDFSEVCWLETDRALRLFDADDHNAEAIRHYACHSRDSQR